MLYPTRVDDVHGLGSVTSDVADGGESDLGPPVADDRPRRPLLLRSGVPLTPEESAREPSAGSASASSGSGLTVSPSYHLLRSRSGGDNMRTHDDFVADLMAGVIDATEEEKEYSFPSGRGGSPCDARVPE